MKFFSTMGLMLSGPAALSGCKFFSNLEIPSDAMYISGIQAGELGNMCQH